jgi:hypothetical protein
MSSSGQRIQDTGVYPLNLYKKLIFLAIVLRSLHVRQGKEQTIAVKRIISPLKLGYLAILLSIEMVG